MTIYLTEPSNLTAGLWWARRITGDRDLGCGPWLVIGLIGTPPFLVFYVVVSYDKERHEWRPHANYDQHGGRANNPLDPNEWEFGPRIDIPSDKDRAEYPPQVIERQPTR